MLAGLEDLETPIAQGASSPLSAAISERDRDVMNMVRDALKRKQVMLAFQPIVKAGPQSTIAFYEGLIRVLDADGRIIPAKDFIETVEDTQLGRIIDCLALELGLQALAEDPSLRLSINMSARSIGFPRWLQTMNHGLSVDQRLGERLILEITETSAIQMPELVVSFMAEMEAKGIAFALDDFGAGFTSFRYLKDFFFDVVKIDSQFINGIADSPDNQVLVRALVSICQHFDMFSVAEGVERQEDALFLNELGVDCLQGFYFAAPSIKKPSERASGGQRSA